MSEPQGGSCGVSQINHGPSAKVGLILRLLGDEPLNISNIRYIRLFYF